MSDIQPNPSLVACCGLFCGACKRYMADKCKGCRENTKATWCKIRTCCIENNLETCAACRSNADPNACNRFNNLISKLFGLIFNSDRAACIALIKKSGIEGYAKIMAEKGKPSIGRSKDPH